MLDPSNFHVLLPESFLFFLGSLLLSSLGVLLFFLALLLLLIFFSDIHNDILIFAEAIVIVQVNDLRLIVALALDEILPDSVSLLVYLWVGTLGDIQHILFQLRGLDAAWLLCRLHISLLLLYLHPLGVDMIQDRVQLLEVAISDHAISLIKDKHVNQGEAVYQVGFHSFIEELPETTRSCDHNGWLVREKPLLLLNRHSSDKAASLDVLLVIWWDDCVYHVFDLESQLSCGGDDQSLDRVKDLDSLLFLLLGSFFLVATVVASFTALFILEYFQSSVAFLDQHVDNWDSKAQCLSLPSLSSDDHVNMRLQEHKALPLDRGRL